MACGEYGEGRMIEPLEIVAGIERYFSASAPLSGRRAIVTSGPTHEAIDPVRYIANRSSGKQGHAIAAALAALGADTVLVTGPTSETDPPGVTVLHIESARDMLDACLSALPADIAVCAAAVADWRPENSGDRKIKKEAGAAPPGLSLVENPDILRTLSEKGNRRPALVVGFAAETDGVIDNATTKRRRKGCDWIVANDVSPATGTFGGDNNTVHLVTADGVEDWPKMPKTDVADRLAHRIADHFTALPETAE
jgi:phosphopantothenoylcysteine decarboxylase/phosphopantothenate--cysteine ligase